jgi:Ca2+-binding EF-hand superfamily protein
MKPITLTAATTILLLATTANAGPDEHDDGAAEHDHARWEHRGDGPGPRGPGARRLRHIDEDGDGQISESEFRGPHEGMVKQFDEDGDGGVTLAEMQSVMENRIAKQQDKMQAETAERFARVDANSDGMITADEGKATAFARRDRDGDGFITGKEMRGGMKARKGKRAERRMKRKHRRHDGPEE